MGKRECPSGRGMANKGRGEWAARRKARKESCWAGVSSGRAEATLSSTPHWSLGEWYAGVNVLRTVGSPGRLEVGGLGFCPLCTPSSLGLGAHQVLAVLMLWAPVSSAQRPLAEGRTPELLALSRAP